MQANLVLNTQPTVQRNLAAGTALLSRNSTPYAVAVSPCGKLVAGHDGAAIVVQDWCSRFQVASAQLPEVSQLPESLVGSLHWSSTSSRLALAIAAGGYQSALVLDTSSGLLHQLSLGYSWSG